jgi:hypothetical protein
VILIRTAEDENVVGLQRVAEPVDDEELDAIDGSVAEGDDDIAPEADTDDDRRRRRVIVPKCAERPVSGPFAIAAKPFTATLTSFC